MSRIKQAKRARFYDQQRRLRRIGRISKLHRSTPGFLFAITGLTINGVRLNGEGAMFGMGAEHE